LRFSEEADIGEKQTHHPSRGHSSHRAPRIGSQGRPLRQHRRVFPVHSSMVASSVRLGSLVHIHVVHPFPKAIDLTDLPVLDLNAGRCASTDTFCQYSPVWLPVQSGRAH